MVILDYYPLDLQISKGPEGSYNLYTASILENGDIKATQNFELRRDLKLIQMLDRIEEKVIIPKPQPEEITHIEFGKMLYNTVFSGELGDYFNKRFNECQDENCGLRISMRFSEDVPDISILPWEYLHDEEDFLITRRNILLSRLPPEVKKTESKPLDSILRMLVVISGPDDPRISPLNTEKEQEIILEALDRLQKEQKIKVDFTEDATFENIQGYLNEQNYQIVHFTGHGINIGGKGHLVFESEDRKARLIDNKILADLFSDMGIKLVVLSSCESAKGSNKEAFGDLASMLSKRRIPAVVAMQYSVLDDVATKFAQVFYRTIASGKSVDVALKEARIAMKDSEKSNGLDFATPVLYLSDCNCVQVGKIKPEPSEFEFKLTKLSDLLDLPVMNKGFVARKKELRILEKGFRSDVKRAAIIHGFGGIGKTALATRLAKKMEEYFDGTFGMRCTSTTRPEDILNKINSFLMMKGRSELNQIINQQVPLEVKTAMLVNILNQLRFLIILDNFEDCLDIDRKQIEDPELKAFIRHLLNNTISNTKFIITTRYDFDPLEGRLSESIEHISLPELHFPQTNWLMNNYKELADLDIKKKRQIYDVIGGHPWTVGQFAKRASVQGVDSLLLDLKPLKKELIEFTLLDKSFSKLDADTKKLLLCTSIYEEAAPVEALSWIVGNEKDESPSVGEPLQRLIQWGLISKEQEYDQTVYTEHTIVRDFSQSKLNEEGLNKNKLLIRAAKYYENLVSINKDIWDHLKARDYYYRAEDWDNASRIVKITSADLFQWGYIELGMNLLNESIKTISGIKKTEMEFLLSMSFKFVGDWKVALKICDNCISKCKELQDHRTVAYNLKLKGMVHQDQGNYEEANNLYNQSLEIFRELEDEDGELSIMTLFGMIHHGQDRYEEAAKCYTQVLETLKLSGNKGRISSVLHQLGNLKQDTGNFEEAIELYGQSLEISMDIGNKCGIANTLNKLGHVNLRQGNFQEAIELYNQSLEISKELGLKDGIESTLFEFGLIHQLQGNYEEAVKFYNQSLDIAKELKDQEGIANTLHNIGYIRQTQGDHEEALELYTQSLNIYQNLESKNGIAKARHAIGNIYQDLNNYNKSTELYNQSLEISEELEDKELIAGTLHELGVISKKQGNFNEAAQLLNKSLKISTEIGHTVGIANTSKELGNICLIQEDFKEATILYNQSLEISNKLCNKSEVAAVLHQLGLANQYQGNYQEANKFYTQSFEIYKELEDKVGTSFILHQLGNINFFQGNYKKAVNFYNQSLEISKKLRNRNEIAGTLYQLGQLHEKMGEYSLALEAYLKASSIFESLNSPYSKSISQLISKLRYKFRGEELNDVFEKLRKQDDF